MDIPYPAPDTRIGNRRFWKKGTHRDYIAKITGQSGRQPQPDDDDLMTAVQVRRSLGGVSSMWLTRHVQRPADHAAAPA